MWYLKLFLVFLMVIVLLLFGFLNKGQTVSIHWLSKEGAGFSVDFIFAIFVAYLLGGVTFFVIGGFRELRLRHRANQIKKRLDSVTQELNALRTASLEGPLDRPREGRQIQEYSDDNQEPTETENRGGN